MKKNHSNFLNLAFNLAKINLGKTNSNPSVGCVVVKNESVISSGITSINGRPHAEFNALNKKIDFSGSNLYVTMEPCIHYGLTPPCISIIIKKKINKVYFSFYDADNRTSKKSKDLLKNKKIKVFKIKTSKFKNFYQSYFLNKKKSIPLIDAKIALSKDYYTINKKKKWITNSFSRNRGHLIRSEYDGIISTSKSINKDNSLLNCRLKGFNQEKPDIFIIDLNLKIRTNLNLFKLSKKRKIFIITTIKKDKKISFLNFKGVKFIKINSLYETKDFIYLFKLLKKKGYNRILVESGLNFLSALLVKKLVYNLYIFKSATKLGNNGLNKTPINLIKGIKMQNKIKVNLNGEELYKVKIK